MKIRHISALRILAISGICSLASLSASGAFLSSNAQLGDKNVSLDDVIPELNTLTFTSTQPSNWQLYRKVVVKSTGQESWLMVGSCASPETSWTTPASETMAFMPAAYEACYTMRDGMRLTSFKIACQANSVTEEKEFLWNVYPTTPKMDILDWTFDLDTANRVCENSDLELEITCAGQEQYAIGITSQSYFSMPENMSDVKFSYVRFNSDENVYKTTVIGQWGWIMHVVAVNHFGSTPGNYLLTNDYISDPEQKKIINEWNPDVVSSVADIEDQLDLYALTGRLLLLSNAIDHALLYDTNGLIRAEWSEGGIKDLSSLPNGFYILTIQDTDSHHLTRKILLK